MPDVNSIHKFYEHNLPGYKRSDFLVVTKFFVSEMKGGKKPIVFVLKNWTMFQDFVCKYWQGQEIKPFDSTEKRNYCKCGGKMKKRLNKTTGEEFLGCTNYPQCKHTLKIE